MSSKKHSLPWKLVLFLVVMILMVSACGGDDDPQVEGSTSNNNENSSESNAEDQNISNPITNTDDQDAVGFEALDDTDDWLLYVEGTTLYLTRFNGDDPTFIAEYVHPPTVTIAPGASQFSFTAGERRRSLSLVDVETANVDATLRVSSEYGFMGPWSPDGEWMMVFNFPSAYLARTDGSESYRVGGVQNTGFANFWLADNTLLTIETPNNTGVADVKHIDPATGDEFEIEESVEQDIILAFNNQQDLEGVIAFQETVSTGLGVDLSAPFVLDPEATPIININAPPANAQGVPDRCGTFEIQERPLDLDAQPTTLLSVEGTVFITNQTRLNDGTVLFVRWYFENCDSADMRAAIMRVDPDGNVDVITDEVDPGTSPNLSFFFGDTGNRMSVSSDQNYIVWSGGGLEAGVATLNVTHLGTLETTVLIRNEQTSSNSSTFHLDSTFNSVNFVPR